jgi:hypothetical protein
MLPWIFLRRARRVSSASGFQREPSGAAEASKRRFVLSMGFYTVVDVGNGYSTGSDQFELGTFSSTFALPEDVQNIRAFGKEGAEAGLEGAATVINDRLEELRRNIDATLEYHRAGALGGLVLDASGDVLTNLFDAFGVQKQTLAFALATESTNALSMALTAKRMAEKKLEGVLAQGFSAACSPEFFDALTGHKNVKAAYANWQAAQDRLGGDLRSGFVFGGIEFSEDNSSVGGRTFIPEGKARFYPRAPGIFKQYFAPADYMAAVNSIGKPYYAASESRKMDKGQTLEVQSNPITLCHYPEALVELSIS